MIASLFGNFNQNKSLELVTQGFHLADNGIWNSRVKKPS